MTLHLSSGNCIQHVALSDFTSQTGNSLMRDGCLQEVPSQRDGGFSVAKRKLEADSGIAGAKRERGEIANWDKRQIVARVVKLENCNSYCTYSE